MKVLPTLLTVGGALGLTLDGHSVPFPLVMLVLFVAGAHVGEFLGGLFGDDEAD